VSTAVQREPNGHWVAGTSGNPSGSNQWTERESWLKRRAEARLDSRSQELLTDPVCVETIVQNLIKAMECPEELPLSAKIAFERLWPVIQKHELSTDGGSAEDSSASQWDELADRAGEQVAGMAEVAGGQSVPVTIDGAD
jgi:hypothetical protein